MCVSQDAPGLRGRADVLRAQDLDGAASLWRVCVTRHTCGAASMRRVCVTTHLVEEVEPMSIALKTSTALRACGACVSPDTWSKR